MTPFEMASPGGEVKFYNYVNSLTSHYSLLVSYSYYRILYRLGAFHSLKSGRINRISIERSMPTSVSPPQRMSFNAKGALRIGLHTLMKTRKLPWVRRSRRNILALLVLSTFLISAFYVASPPSVLGVVSPNVVISQVYAGGGNAGATYTHDFIALFNRGNS